MYVDNPMFTVRTTYVIKPVQSDGVASANAIIKHTIQFQLGSAFVSSHESIFAYKALKNCAVSYAHVVLTIK